MKEVEKMMKVLNETYGPLHDREQEIARNAFVVGRMGESIKSIKANYHGLDDESLRKFHLKYWHVLGSCELNGVQLSREAILRELDEYFDLGGEVL